jgi:hypothetical protein
VDTAGPSAVPHFSSAFLNRVHRTSHRVDQRERADMTALIDLGRSSCSVR